VTGRGRVEPLADGTVVHWLVTTRTDRSRPSAVGQSKNEISPDYKRWHLMAFARITRHENESAEKTCSFWELGRVESIFEGR
jgi:hypothetical protein